MKTFWVCSKNKFLSSIPYLNLLKSRCNHSPDSAIEQCITLQTHTRFADLCVKLAQCVGILIGKLGKHDSKQESAWETHEFFFLSFFFHPTHFFFLFPPFIIIYYFARYSSIACIMLLKPMLARSQRPFRN